VNEYSVPLSPAGQSWQQREAEKVYQDIAQQATRQAERTRQREAVTRISDNPDQAGEARRISREAGVPAPLVQARLPDYKADQRRAQVAEAARDERVGPWLAQNADVASDDIATLINLGQTGPKFSLAQEGSPTRFRITRQDVVDDNFRPSQLSREERQAIIRQSRTRDEYRSRVADVVIARNAPTVAAQTEAEEVQSRMDRGVLGQIGGSLRAGNLRFWGGLYGFGANVAGVAGQDDLERLLLQTRGQFDERANDLRARDSSFVLDSAYQGLESVPVGVAGLLSGSSAVTLGLFFTQTSGNSYAEARGAGIGVGRSTLYGTTQGAIEVVTERVSVGAMLDIAKGGGSVSRAMKRFFLGEVIGEQAATFFQDLNTWATLTPDRPISEFWEERPEAAARTFFATLSGSGVQGLAAYGLHRAGRQQALIDTSEQQLTALDELMRAAAESKTRGRDTEAFRDLISQVAGENQRVFLPGEVIAQFNQSYREDPFWKDYADEIDEAVATGGEVNLPLADVAARLAGTQDWEALGASARMGADGMSRAEIDEINALVETDRIEVADEVEAADRVERAKAAPGVKLRQSIRDQLMNAGQTPDVASANAEIAAALFETEAANLGREITGDEFSSAIAVQRELPGLIERSQAADELDIIVNAMRAGGEVNVGVGPSLIQFIGQQGGINDTGGDLAAMGLPKRLIRDFDPAQATNGLSGAGEFGADNIYRAAISAGYFPELSQVDEQEGVDTLDTNDFLAAISRELAGERIFSETREEVYRRAGEELRQILEEAGVNADTADMAEIRAAVDLFNEGRSFDQGEDGPRGQIQFTDALAIIKLFESANLTTFQHEMAHFWLERFKGNALASIETDGNPAARSTFADWETVKAWFAENGHAVAEDGTIPTEAHELWARSWERYLMEGKSPKTSLNSVFRKMAQWFRSVYRSIKSLNAPVAPEIREVMDRMLATEDEIAAAGQDRAMMLMFDDAVAAGMTEAEAMRYRALGDEARSEAEEELYGKVMRSIRARETKAWKEQERIIRSDITDMVENRPVFQALAMLRGQYRLNRKWLVDTYGIDALKMLPAGVPPIYREGGENADQVAEMVGFRSGDEMVRELMGLESLRQRMKLTGDKRSVKKATIDQEVAEEMNRRFGDPLSDGSIEREAAAAIQNERQGERLEMELRALASQAGKRATPYALAKEWAKAKVARGVVSETVSGEAQHRYTRTASKAARAATAAFAKGDSAEAFKQKQIEMLHNALAREAAEAGDRIDRAVKRMGKLAKQRTVKSLAPDYLEQIHGLLEGYEFKRVSQRQLNARDNYARWAEEQQALGHDVVAVERLAQSKNWSRLTVEEILALDDAVKGLVHLGKLKRSLMDNKARRDLDAVVGEAVASAARLPQKERKSLTGGEGWLDAVKHGILSTNAALRKMEDVFDRLDGFKTRSKASSVGVFNRIVMRPLVEAQAAERELLDDVVGQAIDAMKAVPKESLKRWQQKRTIDELQDMDRLGRPLPRGSTMLGEELIVMALNMGNRGNMEKLIGGRQWDKQYGSMEAARAVVLDVLNRELTVEDWRYVEQVWEIVDSLWPALSVMEKRVNGFAPDKVEAVPVETAAGVLRGGYFPVVYDPTTRIGQRNLEVEENGLFAPSYFRATTRAGSTRERTEFKGPLHLSLGVINRHLAEVVHDITHREAIINADKFLSDQRVITAVTDAVGPEIQAQFRPWLQHIANEWAADREGNSVFERNMKAFRTNATMVGLGFRISTVMLQVSGYANSIERVGLVPIVRGMMKARWSPEAWSFALDTSKELRGRMASMDRDIRDNARRLASQQGGILDAPQRFAFHGIGYMDRLVTVATWHGAYDKSLSEGASHDDAVFFADKMVRQSQGSGAAKDMARVQRGTGKMGEALKLATMFYSYSSAFYQRQLAFGIDARDAVRERDLEAVPDLAARFLWLNIVPALASALLAGNWPDDDEDEGAWVIGQLLKAQFQGIPIARDIAGALESGFGYSFTPAEGFGRSVVSLSRDVGRVAEGEETKRMTRNFLETVGYATGKVPGQLATSTQFLVDVGAGDEDPETAAEWWRGITKGSAEKK
jgi:hypothetical protein